MKIRKVRFYLTCGVSLTWTRVFLPGVVVCEKLDVVCKFFDELEMKVQVCSWQLKGLSRPDVSLLVETLPFKSDFLAMFQWQVWSIHVRLVCLDSLWYEETDGVLGGLLCHLDGWFVLRLG